MAIKGVKLSALILQFSCGFLLAVIIIIVENVNIFDNYWKVIMRKLVILIILAVVLITAVSLSGCFVGGVVTGSGNLVTEEMDFSGFTRVEVGYAFEVVIVQSGSYSVSITVDDNLSEFVRVSKTGETLKIGLKSGYSCQSGTLKAVITMPELHGLTLSGGSRGTVGGFHSSQDFKLNLSGASSVTGGITTDSADFSLSGASTVDLTGSANDVLIRASGGSQLYLDRFPVRNADVNLSGGSEATVKLDGTLKGNLSGGSQLYYVGETTIGDIDISGGSVMEKIKPPRLSP